MDKICRQRFPIHTEYKLIYYLTKDIIDASIYDTSLFNYMPDIDVFIIEDEEVNEEEFVPCTLENYNIFLENYLEEYFKDLEGLPLGLSTKDAWDFSIHMAHKMFQYWLYLAYKILHLDKVSIEMKELLIYKLNKDLLLYHNNYQHILIFNPVIYNLEHHGGLMSPQAKLNYKGHFRYPNMCNCTKYSTVSSDQWKIFTCPSLHLVLNYPSFLNSDKKWTYAVYNCTCIHTLVAIIKSILESNLNYWDEVIVISKFVSDVIQLNPMNRYLFECTCILKNWDEEEEEEGEENYFDINKYDKISDFPNELKTNFRWNKVVNLSVHYFEYFKNLFTCIDSPTYRYKYGNAEKILHQFCLDLVFLFNKKENM